jgi:hypothetical protein
MPLTFDPPISWSLSADNINKVYTLHGPFDIKIRFNKEQIETFSVGKAEEDIGGPARLRIRTEGDVLISFERLWKTKTIILDSDEDVDEGGEIDDEDKSIPKIYPHKKVQYPYVAMEYGSLSMSLPDNGYYETMIEVGKWVYNWCTKCLHDMKTCGWKKCDCPANGYFIVGKKQK